MLLLDRLAEEQINAAIRRGEFDELEGSGEPLVIEDEPLVPESLRVAHRMLGNAGCLPPDLMLRREITELEGLLHSAASAGECSSIQGRLGLLRTLLKAEGRELNLLVQDGVYREKLLQRLGRDD